MIQVFQEKRKPSLGERLSAGLDRGMQFGQQVMQQQLQKQQMQRENEAAKNLGFSLEGFETPEFRQQILKSGLENQTKAQQFAQEMQRNKQITQQLEIDRGLEPGSLDAYVNDPKMAEQVSRPQKPPPRRLSEMPIDPEQKANIAKARAVPGFNEMDELKQYQTLVENDVSPELAEKESKLRGQQLSREGQQFDKSYEAQKDFIDETTSKYKAFETEMKPRLMQMQKIATDEDLIGPASAKFLETLDIPLGLLENPSNELYDKISQDLLKGLPETYGNKILLAEVQNFLKTIPRLVNSPSGRRMIASNMLKLGEMKSVFYDEMRRQQRESLDNGKPLPKDFQQTVFDQVKPQIDRINNEFVKLSEIKDVPPDTSPYFGQDGQIYFVPKKGEQEWVNEFQLRKIW